MVVLARWCVRRRKLVLVGWLALLVGLGFLLGTVGTAFSNSSRLPASDSSTAYTLLGNAGSKAASAKTGTIVWHSTTESAVSSAVQSEITPLLQKVSATPGVGQVVSPFTTGNSAQVSKDGHTAYATVVITSKAKASTIEKLAKDASTPALTVQTGGSEFTNQTPSESSELIGIIAALVILLLVFRSLWAALLPIITGIAGVGVSTLAVMLLSNVLTLPSIVTSLGALIGLGVGIDYALFIVNRHRKGLRQGAGPAVAIETAMNTSGRAVLFAGTTVIIALLGMLVLGVGLLTGMAVGAALTVLLTVAAAVTLLPALLAIIGRKILPRRERATDHVRTSYPAVRQTVWSRWAGVVERRPLASATAGLAVLVLLAAPVFALRLGSADASSDPTGTSTRSYYDTMAAGFGAGFDSQLLVVAETPDDAARTAWETLVSGLPNVSGIASVSPVKALTGNTLSMVTVTPTSTAQAAETSDLVTSLRSGLIRPAEAGTDLSVHIGGTTATSIDYAKALTGKLPIFLVIIAGLGFLLLTIAFRSLLVPAIGAISNLLTIAVALGTTVALFQWGWGPSVFGIGGPSPIEYIVAILIVGVVFGLSMDYHVFLVSRMREEWDHTRDNRRAIHVGVSDTGSVIATAAGIMACVFAAFGFSGLRTTSEFGVGLALAVLADAFLLRMTVIPALMHLCGARNWALPKRIERVLPHLAVEGLAAAAQPVGEREPANAG